MYNARSMHIFCMKFLCISVNNSTLCGTLYCLHSVMNAPKVICIMFNISVFELHKIEYKKSVIFISEIVAVTRL